MKVKELIEQLNDIDPELEVICQRDSEGNGYSPLEGVDANAIYIAETTWSGDVYDRSGTAEDADMAESEWGKLKKDHPCAVILFPVN